MVSTMSRSGPTATPPALCPACSTELYITRLQCPACGTEVSGAFSASGRLLNLPEPHASLLELFIRVRGNVKEMERELGLSYPTVRARLEEAFAAARPKLSGEGGGTPLGPAAVATGPVPTPAPRPTPTARPSVVTPGAGASGQGQTVIAGVPGPQGAWAQHMPPPPVEHPQVVAARSAIVGQLERGEITPSQAASLLRALQQ